MKVVGNIVVIRAHKVGGSYQLYVAAFVSLDCMGFSLRSFSTCVSVFCWFSDWYIIFHMSSLGCVTDLNINVCQVIRGSDRLFAITLIGRLWKIILFRKEFRIVKITDFLVEIKIGSRPVVLANGESRLACRISFNWNCMVTVRRLLNIMFLVLIASMHRRLANDRGGLHLLHLICVALFPCTSLKFPDAVHEITCRSHNNNSLKPAGGNGLLGSLYTVLMLFTYTSDSLYWWRNHPT